MAKTASKTKMTDMAMTAAELKEYYGAPTVATDEQEKYPWGLRISLCKDELEKLGIKKLPATETPVTIHAVGYVCDVSENQTAGQESNRSICIQITALQVEEGAEEEDDDGPGAADRMYPAKKA